MRERTNVLVVGDYPPPYGGLSVQVSVLRGLLDASGRHRCRVLDIGESRRERRPECLPARTSIELAARLLRYAAAQWVIHLHTSGHNRKSWLAALACATAGLLNGRKTALSLGSGQAPDWIRQSRGAMRAVVRLTLGLTGTIICRNERSRAAIAALGVPGRKVAVVSGFYGLGPAVDPTLPDAVETFLREHSPVVGAVASIGPEYGLPLIAETAARLRTVYPRLGLLLMGPAPFEHAALGDSLLQAGQLPHPTVLAAMRRLDVFVRPTYFDGDASSVREALALGVPVVASDTDFRPEGVVVFRRGDVGALSDALRIALADRARRPIAAASEAGSWPRLLQIYDGLAGHPRLVRRRA